ncbi:hypothetical protein, partial [Helicobacter sp. L8]|uniref:hypothetical protein n=1 Tax=Helicobacter sp. L8 TaxID=2316078 RepID=UPI000EB1CA88
MKKALSLSLYLCCGASAHPFASYLDGAFMSFGMDVGGGSALESVRSAPNANAAKIAAYKANLAAYNNALTQLKANQAQTLTQLQKYAQQLASLNPNSTQIAQILATLQDRLTRALHVQALTGLEQDTSSYQNYLNQLISSYQAKNQALLTQAQESITQYKSALGNVNKDNQQTLTQALNTLNTLNTQATQAAKELGITYTPITPPVQSSQISSLTPAQVIQAINTLASDIKTLTSTIGTDISQLSNKDKGVALQNANKVAQLTNAANAAKTAATSAATAAKTANTKALSQIAGIAQILGQAFHNQWMQYAVGEKWGKSPTGINNLTYANSGRTCIIPNIVAGNMSSAGPHNCGSSYPSAPELPTGLTLSEMWNTLFNVAQLSKYGASQYVGAEPYFANNAQAQAAIKQEFAYLNSYLSPSNFAGNFTNSKLYTMFSDALSSGNIAQAQSLLKDYTSSMIPYMLGVFEENQYWLGRTPSPTNTQENNAFKGYCTSGGPLWIGLDRCQHIGYGDITFLGGLAFNSEQVASIIGTSTNTQQSSNIVLSTNPTISAQASIASSAITSAQSAQSTATSAQAAATKAQQALSDFKPTPLPYPIP